MTDIQHEKYAKLMSEVETLEDQIFAMKKEGTLPEELRDLLEALAEARSKLARTSDGCGGPTRAS